MIEPGLTGKHALVTGGNHGIGAATARALAAQGAHVSIQYLRIAAPADTATSGARVYHEHRAATADNVVTTIRQSGGQASPVELDLADPNNIVVLLDHAEEAFGPVHILVNNAAYDFPDTFRPPSVDRPKNRPQLAWNESIATVASDIIDRHFAVNARAVALLMTEFARRHVDRGASWGRIINVSTDGASDFPSEVSYGASKYAMESYSRAAASELARYGITVNVVSPGPIQTGYLTPEHEARAVRQTPLGRIGLPEDVADVIVFIASEQARWLTGQLLFVGGGHRME